MKILTKYFTLLISVLFFSCTKEPVKEPDNEMEMDPIESEYGYELIWEKILRKDSLFDAGINCILDGDQLFYSRALEGTEVLALDQELVCLDNKNGEELWTWKDSNSQFFTQPVVDDEIIAFESKNRYYILDRYTGELKYESNKLSGNLVLLRESGINSLIGNINYGSGAESYKTQVLEISKETGFVDTLVTHLKNDDFEHLISHPALHFNEEGDKILLYYYKRYNYNEADLHMDFIKYNVSEDSIEWQLQDFSVSNGSGARQQPIIIGNRIYTSTTRAVYCFDLDTGNEIWRSEHLQTNFTFTNVIINNGILNIHSDTGDLIGIDIETGNLLYKFDYGPTSYAGLTYYDGKIFYATDELIIAVKIPD